MESREEHSDDAGEGTPVVGSKVEEVLQNNRAGKIITLSHLKRWCCKNSMLNSPIHSTFGSSQDENRLTLKVRRLRSRGLFLLKGRVRLFMTGRGETFVGTSSKWLYLLNRVKKSYDLARLRDSETEGWTHAEQSVLEHLRPGVTDPESRTQTGQVDFERTWLGARTGQAGFKHAWIGSVGSQGWTWAGQVGIDQSWRGDLNSECALTDCKWWMESLP